MFFFLNEKHHHQSEIKQFTLCPFIGIKRKKWGNTFASLHQVHVSFSSQSQSFHVFSLYIYIYIFLVCRKSVSGHWKQKSQAIRIGNRRKGPLIPSIRLSIHSCTFLSSPSSGLPPFIQREIEEEYNHSLRKENNKIPATHLWFPL